MNLWKYAANLAAIPTLFSGSHAAIRLAPLTEGNIVRSYLDPFKGTLLQPILRPRVPGTEQSVQVQNFLISELTAAGFETQRDTFTAETPHGPINMTNVVAHRPKRQFGSAKLTLAAHYDSKIEPQGFVGAIDSALPCALLLFIAKAAGQTPLSTAADIDFIFFDGEEAQVEWTETDSIYGARHAAETLPLPRKLLLLDLLGHKSLPIPSWIDSTHEMFTELESLNLGLVNAKAMTQRLLAGDAREFASAMQDDHVPFVQKGVPCLHLIPHTFPPQWHTIDDNAELLDWKTILDWAVLLESWLVKGGCSAELRLDTEKDEL